MYAFFMLFLEISCRAMKNKVSKKKQPGLGNSRKIELVFRWVQTEALSREKLSILCFCFSSCITYNLVETRFACVWIYADV